MLDGRAHPHRRSSARAVTSLGLERLVAPERAQDGRSLVALADTLVSAGGTMNREAAVLGTPVWSIFEGPLGGVDEMLMREGRLRLLRSPRELVVERKPPARSRTGFGAIPPTCCDWRCRGADRDERPGVAAPADSPGRSMRWR